MKLDDFDILGTFVTMIVIFAVVIFFVAFAVTLGFELAELIVRHL